MILVGAGPGGRRGSRSWCTPLPAAWDRRRCSWAAAAGARVFATAGSPQKTALATELGAELAINYRTDDFVAAVLEATGDFGVDLVFDGVGGEVTERSLQCLARNGRHLIIGFAGGIEAEDRPGILPRSLCFGQF